MIKRTLCIENPAHLKCRNEQLIVSYSGIPGMEDMPERTAPVEDIGILVLEHRQITVSHYLLDRLMQNNASVIICNETHHPSGMLLCLDSNTLQSERHRAQAEASEPLKKKLWQQTVKAKIYNQAVLLHRYQQPAEMLFNYSRAVKSGDSENLEAQAAAYYWQRLFPPAWQFFRKREGPPPNNLLNYGYAILRASIARALSGSGLLPTLGIFHRNRYNAYCLADDMMEPYRPFVDAVVRSIIDTTSNLDPMSRDIKNRLLMIPALDVEIQDETSPLFVAVQRTATSLAKCFIGDSKKLALPLLK